MGSLSFADLDAALRHVVVSERRRQGHTQMSLARAAQIQHTHLCAYESARKWIGLRRLVRLSGALGVPLSELVARAEGMVGT